MLSGQEQRIWDDVRRFWAEEVDEPPRAAQSRTERSAPDPGDPPHAVVAGAWIAILLVIFGAMITALAVGLVTALGWAVWHHWPRLGRTVGRAPRADDGGRRRG